MKDEGIEALLARLQPAAPDAALMERLRAARPQPRSRRVLYLWVPLAAAAALAIALIPRQQSVAMVPETVAAAPEQPQESRPVASLEHLMEVADLGIVQDQHDMPVQLIRTRWIDEILYESPEGGDPVTHGRLREEVIPLSLPVY